MKKNIFFVCLIFSFVCFAKAPYFNLDAENVFVIDANSIDGKAREDLSGLMQVGGNWYYFVDGCAKNDYKSVIDIYENLRKIALVMKDANLDIPLREMSYGNGCIDVDKAIKMPKILIK